MYIADRNLIIRQEQSNIEVSVRIVHPELDRDVWICRYEIEWPEGRRSSFAAGIDSVQALHLTLQKIGIDLYMSPHHASGQLIWMKPGAGYGFPVPKNGRDVLIGEDKTFEG